MSVRHTLYFPRFRGFPLRVRLHPSHMACTRGAMMMMVCFFGAACVAPTPQPAPRPSPTVQEIAPPVQAPPPVDAVLPKPAPAQPSMLSGLTNDQVSQLMGAPHFRRVDDPAALWQYRTDGCVLDVYLRADGPVYRVVYFEFRPDPKTSSKLQFTPDDVGACFARLAQPSKDARG